MSRWQYPTPPPNSSTREVDRVATRSRQPTLTPLAWWLRLTSSGWQHPPESFAESELARRSRLASLIFLGLLITGAVFLTAGAEDIPTLLAILAGILGVIIACILNRLGQVWAAGLIVTMVVILAVFGAILSAPGGQLAPDYLPSYDILVLSVVVAGSLLTPAAAFYVAVFNSAAIAVDFLVLQPHSPDLATEINQDGLGLLLGRPIGLEIAVAVVAYLWVSGTINAARRADRAEEMAALEHAYAEQRRQLEVGVQQILATHVRIANGDFSARAPLSQDNVLWQIAASLNNLLGRLQKAGQADYRLQRTDEEIDRLVVALHDLQTGRHPIWPAPAGTSADKLLAMLTPPRLREPGQASQIGQRATWEGSAGPMSERQEQQWQMGPLSGGQGPSGGIDPLPSPQRTREWSEPPAWFGAGYSNPVPPGAPFAQSPTGRPPMPGSTDQPYWGNVPGTPGTPGRRPSSFPAQPDLAGSAGFAQGWPSLDLGESGQSGQSGQRSQADRGSSDRGADPFTPLDNPWYLPPDE
ncbi:MAG: hypothetical protein ACLQUY_15795 [Ktedonobacterales bacterium]